MFSLPRGAK